MGARNLAKFHHSVAPADRSVGDPTVDLPLSGSLNPAGSPASPTGRGLWSGLRHGAGCLTTRWSRPGQPGVEFGAILALAGRAAHLEAVRRRCPPASPPSLAPRKYDRMYDRRS